MPDFKQIAADLMTKLPELDESAGGDGGRAEQWRNNLLTAGVPSKDISRILAGVTITNAVQALRASTELIVVLSGGQGVGKTTAAGTWLADRVSRDYRVSVPRMFVTAFELERVNRYKKADVDPLVSAPALVIDDLGTEYLDNKNAFSSLIDGILNLRYAARRHTVITTNLNAAEFRESYGERVAGRIRESGDFVSLAGESMRIKQGGRK